MENDETRRTAAALYKAHELFLAQAQPPVSPQAFDAYLLVVQEEGLTASAYMARAGVSKSIMSRWLLDIGDARSIRPGMGLVTIAPVEQSSGEEYTVVLTPKGHELAARITACFRSQEPPAE
jgi:DNA-binding MarR family transcriptional regulator